MMCSCLQPMSAMIQVDLGDMKKNCLFILVDCLRADKCFGNSRTARTPTIDSLCQRGTAFTQSITTTTTTSPSVASILTGLYPLRHGVRSLSGYKLNPSVRTLGQIFRDNGYHTYAEVTGALVPQIGLNKWFEQYNCRRGYENVYSSWYDDLLEKFLYRKFEEPWFIFLHLFELHLPRQLRPKYNSRNFGANGYERALSSLDASLADLVRCVDDNTIIVFHADHGEQIAQGMLQEHAVRLTRYPIALGRKLRLKSASRLHRLGHGFHVYDYLVRVPLIFVGRGILPENKIIPAQVRQIDIFPTIVDLLGLEHPDSRLNGRSLLPLMKGEELPEIPAYCEACGGSLGDKSRWLAGLRTPKWKYVFAPYSNDVADELYDLENDPAEKENIASKRPRVARELRNRLLEIRKGDELDTVRQKVRGLKDLDKI